LGPKKCNFLEVGKRGGRMKKRKDWIGAGLDTGEGLSVG
jgi:hypothetical protein